MSGTAKRSDTEQQTPKDMPSASLATHVTMLGISIADILQAGGTWPPVGTTQRTASVTQPRSAWPAICTTKGGSGISVRELTALSPDELRRLCERQSARESMRWKSLDNCANVTDERLNNSLHERLRSLTDQQREARIHELRQERLRLFNEKVNNESKRTSVGDQLYLLTGHLGYKRN